MKQYCKPAIQVLVVELSLPVALSGVNGTANMNSHMGNGSTDTYLGRRSDNGWSDYENGN
jgi:hypothetical protein